MLLLFGTIFSFTIVALSVSIHPHMPPSNVFSSTEFMSSNREKVQEQRGLYMSCCLLQILYHLSAPLIALVVFQQSGNLWSKDNLHCYGIVIVCNCWRSCISSLPVPPRALTLEFLYRNFKTRLLKQTFR